MAREIRVERYYPSVSSNAQETIDIADIENPEFNLLQVSLEKWFKNGFALDLDIDGAGRWESMLRLTPKSTDGLKDRRRRILARINALLPYTHRRLVEMLDSIYGEGNTKILLNYNKYELRVDLAYPIQQRMAELRRYLRVIVPANLSILIQNSKNAPQSIYVGLRIRKIKHHTLMVSTGFEIGNINNTNYIGTYIRKVKYYKIGGM